MNTIFIDADSFCYRMAYRNTETFDFGSVTSTTLDEEGAKQELDDWMAGIKRKLKASRMFVVLSDPKANWRKEIFPRYKAQRAPEKPLLLPVLQQHLIDKHAAIIKSKLEADDVCGILATLKTKQSATKYGPAKSRIVVSLDKDLLTIPTQVYNPVKDKLATVTEAEAFYNFLTQVLTGDTVDNYKGCPGVGPKKAEDILSMFRTEKEAWRAVVDAYESKGLTEEDALLQARVARICRASDYDFKTQEVKLWQPPKK